MNANKAKVILHVKSTRVNLGLGVNDKITDNFVHSVIYLVLWQILGKKNCIRRSHSVLTWEQSLILIGM